MELRDLIKGCKNDNRNAQRALVDTYGSYLYGVSIRYIRDEQEAKDVVQESLILIFRNIKKFKSEPYAFKAWMRQITINASLQKLRKAYRKKEIMTENHVDNKEEMPEVYGKFERDDILKIINNLPIKYREVFNMYVIDGYSHKEIAKKIGVKESTSRAILTRAKIKVREKVLEIQKMAI